MTTEAKTLTLVQEVLFDLYDLLEHNDLAEEIEGFEEFGVLREFIIEQRDKLAAIEVALEGED